MTFQEKLRRGTPQAGLFLKTPSSEIIEILALARVDFICIDAEHSAFSRRELDWCLALARALQLPALVRLSHAAPETALQALDAGAAGIVVPHVRSAARAAETARWARFGEGGRGYAGSTRSAGFTTRQMSDVLEAGNRNVVVIAQIEDPSGVDEAEEIAAVQGIDALFFGAADLAVSMGLTGSTAPAVQEAFLKVLAAARASGKPVAAFCSNDDGIPALFDKGVRLAFAGSDQGLVLAGARAIAHHTARNE